MSRISLSSLFLLASSASLALTSPAMAQTSNGNSIRDFVEFSPNALKKSPMGYRTDPVTGKKPDKAKANMGGNCGTIVGFHCGEDYAASGALKAKKFGVMIASQRYSQAGNVVFQYMPQYSAVIANFHCANGLPNKVGDFVNAGDDLCTLGSTGKSTGTHAHLEIQIESQTVFSGTRMMYSVLPNLFAEYVARGENMHDQKVKDELINESALNLYVIPSALRRPNTLGSIVSYETYDSLKSSADARYGITAKPPMQRYANPINYYTLGKP